ncbi:hypothetical protein BED47_14640 [Gottfriedia luciferensis]|uniref:Asparagine synthetase domain-containing protein n=1 Tax=Gottfriedia luciferensis TaxID=178774 RepID=A0ABX2ZK46_9BACI|nr:hypothetical protein [Gottfriedia luciferensis]ODG90095.1 hypothetical protein BED47_14640 [Gottfriedia luciferensis]
MYRNQYYITTKEVKTLRGFRKEIFNGLYVYCDNNLVTYYSNECKVCIIGIAFDPIKNLNKKTLANYLGDTDNFETLINKINGISGRYVILIQFNDDLYIFPDAFASKRILVYSKKNETYISSSEKILIEISNKELEISKNVKQIINSKLYKYLESPWIGPNWYDNDIFQVLPNYYYTFKENTVKKRGISKYELSNEDKINYMNEILKGTYRFLSNEFKLIQPLTAGYDSRLLLSASLEYKNQIKYYLFNLPNTKMDRIIAKTISRDFNLDFSDYDIKSLKPDFTEKYFQSHIFPRILPKIGIIQYHYHNNRQIKGLININGNGGEVLKSYYGASFPKDENDFINSIKIIKNQLLIENARKWYKNNFSYCEKYNINIKDLFYWEQRQGIWGSQFPFEQDISLEEISPMNNRDFIMIGLSLKNVDIYSDGSSLFRVITKLNYDKLLSYPFNPKTTIQKIKSRLKSVLLK